MFLREFGIGVTYNLLYFLFLIFINVLPLTEIIHSIPHVSPHISSLAQINYSFPFSVSEREGTINSHAAAIFMDYSSCHLWYVNCKLNR